MKIRRGPATVTGEASPLTPPLGGSREGERKPGARRPLRTYHQIAPSGEGGWRDGPCRSDVCGIAVRSCSPGTGRFVILGPRSLLLLALLAGTAACASPAPATGPLILEDDAGRTVSLAGPATRIASLVPATTEWLFALGAGSTVVGRTAWCDYPAAAAAVPNLGDGIAPNLEAIVAVEPDLVLLYHSPANELVVERLRELGIAALALRTDNLADLDRHLALLGRAIGHVDQADSLRAQIATDLARASVPHAAGDPRVLILAWDQPPMTLGRGSFLSEILERAGARNLFGDLASSSATISIEAVVERDPDFVLVTSADSTPAISARPEWAVVPAVRERRFVRVHGSEFNRPGPRTPDAIRTMRRAIEAARP